MDSELLARRGFTIFLRLMAAVGVLVSHSWPLSGNGIGPSIGSFPIGAIAVSIFFVLSGYFVFSSSIEHRLFHFILLRFARLFPALFVANFIFAFVIGFVLNFQDDKDAYWNSAEGPISYFLRNSTLIFGTQPDLATIFKGNPYPNVVNGSLWTLPIELKCYLMCALIAILVKFYDQNWPLYISFAALSVLYLLSSHGNLLFGDLVSNSTLRLFVIFFSGALVPKMRFPSTGLNLPIKVFTGVFLCTLWIAPAFTTFLYWILIPGAVLIPNWITQKFSFFNKRDFSYGFYLWAFPIQQLIMHFGFATTGLSLLVFSSLVTLCISIGSWYLVELPAIRYTRKYLNFGE